MLERWKCYSVISWPQRSLMRDENTKLMWLELIAPGVQRNWVPWKSVGIHISS
jgi:hypothetical protein